MKSGLEGRNNARSTIRITEPCPSLNEVRPRRPEQSNPGAMQVVAIGVSMKSGLEGRNNPITWS